jgi:hypothetical protein
MDSFAYVTDNELGPGHNYSTSWRDDLGRGSRERTRWCTTTMYRDEEVGQRRGWGHSTASEAVTLDRDYRGEAPRAFSS